MLRTIYNLINVFVVILRGAFTIFNDKHRGCINNKVFMKLCHSDFHLPVCVLTTTETDNLIMQNYNYLNEDLYADVGYHIIY